MLKKVVLVFAQGPISATLFSAEEIGAAECRKREARVGHCGVKGLVGKVLTRAFNSPRSVDAKMAKCLIEAALRSTSVIRILIVKVRLPLTKCRLP